VTSPRTDRWRTKEQVLRDLSKAMHFSAQSLEQNRKGKLAADQLLRMLTEFLRPLGMAAGCMVAPFVVWSLVIAFSSSSSVSDALGTVFATMLHPQQLFEDHWWVISVAIIAATLGCIGFGVYKAMGVSFSMYFDLVERAVIVKEGRIEGREEQIFRESGRDPLENYYFDMKTQRYEVSREAFLAIDSGAAYLVYILPRSRTLVSLEPKTSADDVAEAS
jgi:hypothetical protein